MSNQTEQSENRMKNQKTKTKNKTIYEYAGTPKHVFH
jgi:hypothetical protein